MNYNIFKNKINTAIVSLLCTILMIGCTGEFEDMNRNPGQPTDPDMEAGYYKLGAFFPQMISYAYPAQENAYQMGENLIGDPYGRYLSIANTWTATFSTFNAPAGWINSPFNDAYSRVYGGWTKVNAMTKGQGQLFAWAQIIRVTAMQRMTDLYGPIPYSKVEDGSIAAAYDSQQDAYKNMFQDLDDAIDTLTVFVAKNPNYTSMKPFDKVYQGDFTKWIKYANSLKLRMAMRIVYADPALAKQKAEEAVKHSIGIIKLNTDIAQNAYPQNPIWTMTTAWSDSRICADIVAYMNGYNDPRMPRYFTQSQVTGSDAYLGLRTGISVPSKEMSGKYSSATYAQTAPMLIMNAAEGAFLRAEGALRGWDMGGTAQDLYEQGIKLSFSQWLAEGADAYLNNDTSKPGGINDPNPTLKADPISTITIKWDDAAPFETKLERLMTQKWIAMFPLGQEAWSEQRRTGYPHFYPVLVNNSSDPNLSTRLASRIPFAPDEQKNNTANYNKAVELLGGADNYSTKLWWDKNPNKGW